MNLHPSKPRFIKHFVCFCLFSLPIASASAVEASTSVRPVLADIPDKASLSAADAKFLTVFEIEGDAFIAKHVRDEQAASLGIDGWQRILALFPPSYRSELVQFNVLDGERWAGFFSGDGSNDVDRKGYRLSIAKYLLLKEPNRKDAVRPITPRRETLDWTLVHEMGHYICLRTDSIERFSQVFDGDGKPQPRRREHPDDYATDGSPKLQGNFVTSYAERVGGDEEVVECFTTYMMVPELPTNDSLVAEKIRFFERVEGMPELRAHIQGFTASK